MKLSYLTKYIFAVCTIFCTLQTKGETPQERRLAFSWGAELATGADLSQHNMSSVGINARAGLQWKWVRFFGIGAEGDMLLSSSGRNYPLFFNFQTDFSNSNKLLFMDLRGGATLNYFNNNDQETGAYFSGGVGITLAKGKTFSSHIILAYTYVGQEECYKGDYLRKCPGVSLATLRLGITFGTGNNNAVSTPAANTVSHKEEKNEKFSFTHSDILSYIKTEANKLEVPDQDIDKWKALARDLNDATSLKQHIDIVHIGDSHIQAEMGTSRLREILQDRYGNAGRGLITAFKLAGTNQPVDYAITSEHPVDSQVRLLKRPWPINPGFTGVASLSNLSNRITYKNLKNSHKFNLARIFTSDGERYIRFPEPMDSSQFYAFPGERVFGIYTSDTNRGGVIYSIVGNNGACFSDYLLLDNFSDDIAKFNPRLIILSMGTNEGFSDKTDYEIAEETRALIRDLRNKMPDALFMLWTPMECHGKDDEGNFTIKTRVRDARDIMLDVARDEKIAIWDFYEVAGGYGSAQQWVDSALMNPKDHIHLLNKGYRLQGELAADAILNFLDSLE